MAATITPIAIRSSKPPEPLTAEQEALFRDHLSLVERIAKGMVWAGAELDDLKQLGSIGLLSAVRAFDPGRGVKFSTFAAHRVRGSILDGRKSYGQEVSLSEWEEGDEDFEPRALPEALTTQADFEADVILNISLDRALRRDPRLRRVLEFRVEGFFCPQIAEELGLCVTRVQQLVGLIRVRLRETDDGPPRPAVERRAA